MKHIPTNVISNFYAALNAWRLGQSLLVHAYWSHSNLAYI